MSQPDIQQRSCRTHWRSAGRQRWRLTPLLLLPLVLLALQLSSGIAMAQQSVQSPTQPPAQSPTQPPQATDAITAAPEDSSQPQVSVSLDPEQVAPGETTTLRITVLVPTYLPKPVVFPTLAQPNLRVTLPERATSPTSDRIDGKTWSGVSRSYRLTPLSPGDYQFQDQSLEITYVDPAGGQTPVSSDIALEPQTLSAKVPEAAAGLKPYVAADSIELKQTITVVRAAGSNSGSGQDDAGQGDAEQDSDTTNTSGDTASTTGKATATNETVIRDLDSVIELDAGDSLSREVTATINNGSVILLPTLLDDSAPAGLGVYPASPNVSENATGGARTERVTYVAEGGGEGQLPEVALRWFNPSEDRIDQASLPALQIKVSGPALPRLNARGALPWLWISAITIAVLALAIWLWWQWGRPAWHSRRRQHAIHLEKNGYTALTLLRQATTERRLGDAQQAWHKLRASAAPLTAERIKAVEDAFSALGHLRYSRESDHGQQLDSAWQALHQVLPSKSELKSSTVSSALPPLNPTSPTQ
ncbi:BatD family protein [Halomonas huangheensis]|uniref:Protein BatD n=1 Tax=Halomonas huangheensis TaxID=1178482 RepID=W1N3W2_9GAMM|nr:BatD family protein [Halomonas huangheensis]ALM51701.1 hypothetical protein AR456_04925 [Halomonas huangheensis]ERL50194.1 hypothetical protein BJB45_03445 [Halomonas huangheensis]